MSELREKKNMRRIRMYTQLSKFTFHEPFKFLQRLSLSIINLQMSHRAFNYMQICVAERLRE